MSNKLMIKRCTFKVQQWFDFIDFFSADSTCGLNSALEATAADLLSTFLCCV